MNTLIKTMIAMAIALNALMFIERASAQDTTVSTSCGRNALGGYSCSTSSRTTPVRVPREWRDLSKGEQAQLMADEVARDQRIAKWEAFCKPTARVDDLGVSRYSYAHKGCEYGRYE